MSDTTPQRPDGLNENTGTQQQPRVQVEPTPVSPQGRESRRRTPPPPGAASSPELMSRTVVKTRTKKFPVFLSALGGLAVGAVLVIALVMTGALDIDRGGSVTAVTPDSTSQTIDIDPEDTTHAETVAAKALPSVVSITAQTGEADASGASSGSIGSGVILDKDGNILTNHHVVEGATAISVTLDDGTNYDAELVGEDSSSDLAVIRLQNADATASRPSRSATPMTSRSASGSWPSAAPSATNSPCPRAS